jgi:hypothetical protein
MRGVKLDDKAEKSADALSGNEDFRENEALNFAVGAKMPKPEANKILRARVNLSSAS